MPNAPLSSSSPEGRNGPAEVFDRALHKITAGAAGAALAALMLVYLFVWAERPADYAFGAALILFALGLTAWPFRSRITLGATEIR